MGEPGMARDRNRVDSGQDTDGVAKPPEKRVTEEEGIASARRLHSWYDEANRRKEAQREARKTEAVKGLTFKPVLATAVGKKDGASDAAVGGAGNFGERLFEDG